MAAPTASSDGAPFSPGELRRSPSPPSPTLSYGSVEDLLPPESELPSPTGRDQFSPEISPDAIVGRALSNAVGSDGVSPDVWPPGPLPQNLGPGPPPYHALDDSSGAGEYQDSMLAVSGMVGVDSEEAGEEGAWPRRNNEVEDTDDAARDGCTQRPTGAPARPQGAAGRPFTSRCHNQQGGGPRRPAAKGQGQVVYVDHFHTHHHHHFHWQSEWGGPGDVPPEGIRRAREANAESNVQKAHGGNSGQRKPGASAVRANGAPNGLAGSGKLIFTPRTVSMHNASTTQGSIDDEGPASMPSLDATNVSTELSTAIRGGSGGSSAGKSQVSASAPKDYFELLAQLPGKQRLKFSPYSSSRESGLSGTSVKKDPNLRRY